MKVSRKLALLALVLAGSVGMTGCKSNAKMPVNFVAVTSSDYNATVTFGDYDYKFQGKITQGSSTFTLVGNAVSRHAVSSGGGQGGPGGGFPGGGGFGPGGNSSGPTFEGFGAADTDPGQQPGGGENPGGGDNPFGGGDNPGGGENPG